MPGRSRGWRLSMTGSADNVREVVEMVGVSPDVGRG